MVSRAQRIIVALAVAGLVALGAAGIGCSTSACARHSDCAPGLACGPEGTCVVLPDAATTADGPDAPPAIDAPDAAVDAAVDAPFDATPDAVAPVPDAALPDAP